MGEVSIIGLDLAKNVFQAHGAGSVVFRRKLSRAQLSKFMESQSPCMVAMEPVPVRITGPAPSVISAMMCG
jgi:transposase